MADLKGKRIGIQEPGGFADVLSRGVLRVAKIDPKEVNFVSIASEDVPALVANQVDTAILHVEQVIVAQSKLPSLHAVAQLWEIQPKNLNTVMAVTEKTIADKRAALQAFVKANIEATRLIYTDKAKVLPAIIKYTAAAERRGREGARLHDQELHLGCQYRPRARAHQFHRRPDGKGRQHRARQGAEIRRTGRSVVRRKRRSRSSANGRARYVRPTRT